MAGKTAIAQWIRMCWFQIPSIQSTFLSSIFFNGPIPASFGAHFRSFHIPIQMTNFKFELY